MPFQAKSATSLAFMHGTISIGGEWVDVPDDVVSDMKKCGFAVREIAPPMPPRVVAEFVPVPEKLIPAGDVPKTKDKK